MTKSLYVFGFLSLFFSSGIFLFQNCSNSARSVTNSTTEGSQQSFPEVSEPELFTAQPASKVAVLGEKFSLTVKLNTAAFTNLPEFEWQYKHPGSDTFVAKTDQTMDTILFESFRSAQQGQYRVITRLDGKEYTSEVATVKLAGFSNTCDANEVSMGSPLNGVQNVDWYVSSHFDHDSTSPDTLDYMNKKNGDAITYDGHDALDMAILNFSKMDTNVPVIAVTDGAVELAVDGNFDRNTVKVNGAPANKVTVRHSTGFLVSYYHLKKDSVKVLANQMVKRGDLIGYVGSSGYSSGPHLHLSLMDCSGKKFDLVKDGFLEKPPVYLLPPNHLGSFLRTSTPFTSSADVLNVSGDSLKSSTLGSKVYYAASYLSVKKDDVIAEKFYNPSGVFVFENKIVVGGTRNIYTRYNKWNSFTLNVRGNWSIRHYVNTTKVGADIVFNVR